MSKVRSKLFADDQGVWSQSEQGDITGIEWEEIFSISGYKLDGITEVYTVIELDFEYGEWIELNADWAGFHQVVDTIATKIPDLNPSWLQAIERLQVDEPPITIWQRPQKV
jgi:hypothetical protein